MSYIYIPVDRGGLYDIYEYNGEDLDNYTIENFRGSKTIQFCCNHNIRPLWDDERKKIPSKTFNNLTKLVGCTRKELSQYLQAPEFSHIKLRKLSKTTKCSNVMPKDITLLQQLHKNTVASRREEKRQGVISQTDLASKVGCKPHTLVYYLESWQFAHIKKVTTDKKRGYRGVTKDDIKKLRWLYFSRRRRINYD